MNQKIIHIFQWTHHLNCRYIRRFCDVTCYVGSFKVAFPLVCRNMSKPPNGQNLHFRIKLYRINKSMNTKTYLYLYTKFTHMKHEYKTHITQSPDAYIFMTYVRVIVNQKANIAMNLMKTK